MPAAPVARAARQHRRSTATIAHEPSAITRTRHRRRISARSRCSGGPSRRPASDLHPRRHAAPPPLARAGRRTAARRPSRWRGPPPPSTIGREHARPRPPSRRRSRRGRGSRRSSPRAASRPGRSRARRWRRGLAGAPARRASASPVETVWGSQPRCGVARHRRPAAAITCAARPPGRRSPAPGASTPCHAIVRRADVDRLQAGTRLLDVGARRARRGPPRPRPPCRATGVPRRAPPRPPSRCGCGSRRPRRAVCTKVVSDRRVSRANAPIVSSSSPSASCTTASWFPASGRSVKTSRTV